MKYKYVFLPNPIRTSVRLEGLLEEMSDRGWELCEAGSVNFKFEHGTGEKQYYRIHQEKREAEEVLKELAIPDVEIAAAMNDRIIFRMTDPMEYDAAARRNHWYANYYAAAYKSCKRAMLILISALLLAYGGLGWKCFHTAVPGIRMLLFNPVVFGVFVLDTIYLLASIIKETLNSKKELENYQTNSYKVDRSLTRKKYWNCVCTYLIITILSVGIPTVKGLFHWEETDFFMPSILSETISFTGIEDEKKEPAIQADSIQYSYSAWIPGCCQYHVKWKDSENDFWVSFYHCRNEQIAGIVLDQFSHGYDAANEIRKISSNRVEDERFDELFIGKDDQENAVIAGRQGIYVMIFTYPKEAAVSKEQMQDQLDISLEESVERMNRDRERLKEYQK